MTVWASIASEEPPTAYSLDGAQESPSPVVPCAQLSTGSSDDSGALGTNTTPLTPIASPARLSLRYSTCHPRLPAGAESIGRAQMRSPGFVPGIGSGGA